MKHIFPILITFILFEIFLRYSPFSNGLSPVEYDSDIGMWHKKNFTNYMISTCYKTEYDFDEKGRVKNLYDADISKKDIILLGDSQIEALMVKKENRLQNRLFLDLNGEYNIFNYGLSGTTTSQQYQILLNKADLNNTKYIFQFLFLENDLQDSNKVNTSIIERPKVSMKFNSFEDYFLVKPTSYNYIEFIRDLSSNTELYFYLKKIIYFFKDTIKNIHSKEDKNNLSISGDSIFSEYNWLQLNGPILLTKKLLKEHSIKYHIFFISNNINQKELRLLTEFLRTNEIQYTDLSDFIKKSSFTQEQLFFSCDSHFNDKANIILSRYIKENIENY